MDQLSARGSNVKNPSAWIRQAASCVTNRNSVKDFDQVLNLLRVHRLADDDDDDGDDDDDDVDDDE